MGRDGSESPRRRRHDDDTYSRGDSSDGHRHRAPHRERERGQDRDRPRDAYDDRERRHRDKRRRHRGSDEVDERSEHGGRNHRDKDDPPRDKARRKDERAGRDESDEELLDLKALGVAEISEEDYFLKSAEFKYWLKVDRERYLDELSSESAHKYFRKFLRRWNDGALKEKYYRPPPTSSSSANTAYKWSFASNRSVVDPSQLASIRNEVDRSTHAQPQSSFAPRRPVHEDDNDIGPSLSPRPGSRRLGPTLPSASDRQLALESASELKKRDRKAEQKERYEKADEMVPKSGGKEGKMDEKRATSAANREFREKEVGGLEMDEGTLMGESSFQAALRARDAAKGRREDKRAIELADRRAATDERLADRRAKESATMDMFKALAKQRFG